MAPGGRSTGCKTCRMRHLKCDEARPTCQRCAKAGFECRGYEVIDVFVDERTKILERGSKLKADRRKPAELSLSRRSKNSAKAGRVPPPPVLELVSQRGRFLSDGSTGVYAPSPFITILPLDEDNVYLTFMRRKLLTRLHSFRLDGRSVMMNHDMIRASWLEPALSTGPGGPSTVPLKPAVNALSRAWFAKIQNQPGIAAQGRLRYGKALKELKVALADGRWRERDVLITAMCLILYEAIELTNYEAWANHSRGLAQLIEAQGPESFQDQTGIGILRSMRFPMIMSSVARSVPVFLEREEWCTIPWQQHPEFKTENDFLFDIFARVPRIISRMRAWDRGRLADAESIFEDVIEQLHQLFEWRWSYEMSRANCAWADYSQSAEPASLFPHIIQFASRYDSLVLGNYNSLVILCLHIARRTSTQPLTRELLIPPIAAGLVKSNALLLPGFDEMKPVSIAREICQTLRFRTTFSMDNTVAFGLFLPVRMAWMAFKDYPEGEQWLSEIAAQFEQLSGVNFSKLAFHVPHRDMQRT